MDTDNFIRKRFDLVSLAKHFKNSCVDVISSE